MKHPASSIVLVCSCAAVLGFLVVCVTALPYAVTKDSEGWSSLFFMLFLAPLIGGVALVLGVIPSAVLFWRWRRTVDRVSPCISVITFLLIVITWVLIEPARHWFIFERHRPPGLRSESNTPERQHARGAWQLGDHEWATLGELMNG